MSIHNLSAPSSRANQYTQQRRSQRILLSVSILVSGTKPGGAPSSERTTTMIVSIDRLAETGGDKEITRLPR